MRCAIGATSHPLALSIASVSALCMILFFVYSAGFAGPFTFDDVLVFPATQLSSFDRESILRTLATHNSGMFGRPITVLTFILNHRFFGPEPYAYKVVNVAVHLINTALVFALVRTLLNAMDRRGPVLIGDRRILLVAFLSCSLWAVHPLQVSTVLYVFQRSVLLSSTFSLIGMLAFVSGRSALAGEGRGYVRLFVLFPVALLLAVGSKESGALLVPEILLIELVVFRLAASDDKARRFLLVFLGMFVVIPLVAGFAYFALRSDVILKSYEGRDFTLPDRLRTQAVVMMFYLKLILLPNIADMSLYHDGFPRFRSLTIPVVLSLLVLVTMAVAALALRRRAPVLSLGLGLFLMSHALESTVIPLELVFEHRNYLGILGLALPIAWYATGIRLRSGSTSVGVVATLAVGLLLSGQTFSRTTEWSDELTLNSLAVENHPESPRARSLLIRTLSNLGRHEEAIQTLVEAETSFPESASLRLFALVARCNAGEAVEPRLERTELFLATRTLDQDVVTLLDVLVRMHTAGTCERPDLDDIGRLVAASVANRDKRMSSAFKTNLMVLHAQLLSRKGSTPEAIAALRRALDYTSSHPEILVALTSLQIQAGRVGEAYDTLEKLARVNGRTGNAYGSAERQLKGVLGDLAPQERADGNAGR